MHWRYRFRFGIAMACVAILIADAGVDASSLGTLAMQKMVGGGITVCETEGHFHEYWSCHNMGSFSCTNVCDECNGQPSAAACAAEICWHCATGPNIRECHSAPGAPGMGCEEFGAGIAAGPCGDLFQANCSWNARTLNCYCDATDQNKSCPRTHCKNKVNP